MFIFATSMVNKDEIIKNLLTDLAVCRGVKAATWYTIQMGRDNYVAALRPRLLVNMARVGDDA